jgi:hypothetical protein
MSLHSLAPSFRDAARQTLAFWKVLQFAGVQ